MKPYAQRCRRLVGQLTWRAVALVGEPDTLEEFLVLVRSEAVPLGRGLAPRDRDRIAADVAGRVWEAAQGEPPSWLS